jgi:hypothetical protein
MNVFWRRTAPQLAQWEQACPRAAAARPIEQARLVAAIEAGEQAWRARRR